MNGLERLRLCLAVGMLLTAAACRDSIAVVGGPKVHLQVLQERPVHVTDRIYQPVITITRNGFSVRAVNVYPQQGHAMTASFDQFTTVDRTRVLRLTVNGDPKLSAQQLPWRIEYAATVSGVAPGDYTLWFVRTGRLTANQSPHAAYEFRHRVSIP